MLRSDYLCAMGLVLRARDMRTPVGRKLTPVYVRSHTYVSHFRPGTTLAISGHDASLDPDKVCDLPPAKLAAVRESGRNSRQGKQKGREGRPSDERTENATRKFHPTLASTPVEFPGATGLVNNFRWFRLGDLYYRTIVFDT